MLSTPLTYARELLLYMYTAISVPFFSEASILFLHYVFLHAFRYPGVVMDLSGRSPALLLCPVSLVLATVFSWVIIMHKTGSFFSQFLYKVVGRIFFK